MSMEELTAKTSTMGEEALTLFQRFLVRQITLEKLEAELRAMDAAALLDEHWNSLTHDDRAAAVLEILQLLAYLPEQLAYQVARYGASSVGDDRDQLSFALSRLNRHRSPGRQ